MKKRKKVRADLERPCWVNHADAALLFDLLKQAQPRHPLLGRLNQIMTELEDQAEQIRDLVKQAKATGHFDKELSNIGPVIEGMREAGRKRRRKLESQVAHLAAEEVKVHVAKLVESNKSLKGGL